MVERPQSTRDAAGFGIPMPVFLGIWLVCAIIAGIIWQSLVSGTPGNLVITVPAMLVLSLSFGIAGAGLVSVAVGIFRQS